MLLSDYCMCFCFFLFFFFKQKTAYELRISDWSSDVCSSDLMVVQNPHNGRIYAMQGGFDSRLSAFNRATQAKRQPGSTIKPFVYAAALDNGMTPASIVVDGPFCVFQSVQLGQKCFRNYSGRSA